jgi:hypothetical protein
MNQLTVGVSRIRAIWLALALVAVGCPGDTKGRLVLGEPIDESRAIPLSRLLAADTVADPESVVVSGQVGEVCLSAGCWFVLTEVAEGRSYELLTDLKAGATFTVPSSVRGRSAIVAGRLVGEKPDLKLAAVGVVFD